MGRYITQISNKYITLVVSIQRYLKFLYIRKLSVAVTLFVIGIIPFQGVLHAQPADYLPMLVTWDSEAYPSKEYYDQQISLMEHGHQIIPTVYIGSPGTEITNANNIHYQKIFSLAEELNLPVAVRFPDWKYWLTLNPYYVLPAELNPNYINLDGIIQPFVSPLSDKTAWQHLGNDWGESPIFRVLQQWYPAPPFVLFLSSDRRAEVNVPLMRESARLSNTEQTNGTDEEIQVLIEKGYGERYRALIQSFQETLTAWNDKAIFYYERGAEESQNISLIFHPGLDGGRTAVTQKIQSTQAFKIVSASSNVQTVSDMQQVFADEALTNSTSALMQLWTEKPRVMLLPYSEERESFQQELLSERMLNAIDEIKLHPELREFWYRGNISSAKNITDQDNTILIRIAHPAEDKKLLLALSKDENTRDVSISPAGAPTTIKASPAGEYYVMEAGRVFKSIAAFDGNSDDIPDREQKHVVSLPSIDGTGTVTLESLADCELVNSQLVSTEYGLSKGSYESSVEQVIYREKLVSPEILISTIRNQSPQETSLNIYLPADYLGKHLFLTSTNGDYDVFKPSKTQNQRGRLQISLQDGGQWDADGMVNGEIIFLGIIAPPGDPAHSGIPADSDVVCFPNPFNPSSTEMNIRFDATETVMHLRIFDLGGQLVKSYHSINPGQDIRWDGRNGNGKPVASGTYFVVLENDKADRFVRKISLIR